MKQSKCAMFSLGFAILAFLCAMSVGIAAQDITHPSTTKQTGEPTHEVQTTDVKNAEVIHVSGHEVVVELENGKFDLLNLAEDVRLHVDGNDLTVHELTPGTKLSQEIHTVTTPKEVTTLRTVEGKVWQVNGPHVILSFPEGENKAYTVPDGIVFHIDGQEKTVFDLRKGMQISGEQVLPIPTGVSEMWAPTYSPDGTKIAMEAWGYDADGYEFAGILTVNAVDGSNPQLLSSALTSDCTCWDETPSYSADGSKITFTRHDQTFSPEIEDIYIMNADGTGKTKLTDSLGINHDPLTLMVPGIGERVLFSSNRDNLSITSSSGFEIYSMGVDGTGLSRLTSNALFDAFTGQWNETGSATASYARPSAQAHRQQHQGRYSGESFRW